MGGSNTIKRLLDFVEERCHDRLVLFRGQPADEPLLPKIARGKPKADFLKQEEHLLHEFKIRSAPHLEHVERDDWDWLAIAQHHGMATRLLDWTANPLVALWFAVRESRTEGDDGVVWFFPYSNEDIANQETEFPFKGERTMVFQPKHGSGPNPVEK